MRSKAQEWRARKRWLQTQRHLSQQLYTFDAVEDFWWCVSKFTISLSLSLSLSLFDFNLILIFFDKMSLWWFFGFLIVNTTEKEVFGSTL
jgi:hypothetical protein